MSPTTTTPTAAECQALWARLDATLARLAAAERAAQVTIAAHQIDAAARAAGALADLADVADETAALVGE